MVRQPAPALRADPCASVDQPLCRWHGLHHHYRLCRTRHCSGATLKVLGILETVYAGGDLPPGVNALNQTGNGFLFPGAAGVVGAAGAISVKVARGVFGMDNDSSITFANIGSLVYCADDHTVSTSTNTAAAPVAGTVIAIDGGLVYVDFFQQFALATA